MICPCKYLLKWCSIKGIPKLCNFQWWRTFLGSKCGCRGSFLFVCHHREGWCTLVKAERRAPIMLYSCTHVLCNVCHLLRQAVLTRDIPTKCSTPHPRNVYSRHRTSPGTSKTKALCCWNTSSTHSLFVKCSRSNALFPKRHRRRVRFSAPLVKHMVLRYNCTGHLCFALLMV